MGDFALSAIVTDNGFGVGAAERDVAGYSPTTYGPFQTWDEAADFANMVNVKIGLTREIADSIIASSMRAQNVRDVIKEAK